MTGTGPITITKLEAAERQFRQAVRLHFGGSDPVSAHTLAAAACEILRDVAEHHGVHHPFRNEVLPLFPPVKQQEFIRWFNAPQNFLKHADRDPNESITLDPRFTECLLFEAARAQMLLTGYLTPETFGVFMWLCVTHPDVFQDGPLQDFVTHALAGSISFADVLTVIDSMRAQYGDRLPTPRPLT